MENRLFEEEDHAAAYQKYRFSLPQEIKNLVRSYLKEKKGEPFRLAVDVGCGTGQSTRVLAPHFQKVVGVDISKAQISQAKKVSGPPNISYFVSFAEELPFKDASVDLIFASTAVHWFNIEKFMKEVNRVLKPRGCVALISYSTHLEFNTMDCGDELTSIFNEVEEALIPYRSRRVAHFMTGYKDIFEAVPFSDKERLTDVMCVVSLSVADLIGFLKSLAMFRNFQKTDPEVANEVMRKAEERCLEALGTSSNEAMMEINMKYMCVLGSKPSPNVLEPGVETTMSSFWLYNQ